MDSIKNHLRAIIPREFRNWLRAPQRSLQWAWLDLKHAAGFTDTVEIRPGFSLICHPAAYRFAYHLQDSDPEQVGEFDGFVELARRDMVLFDIGAHFGLFSLAALHYGGPGARAVAVDPSPTAIRMTKAQARLNKVAGRLAVLKASVGDHNGLRQMVAVGVIASGYYVSPSEDHTSNELSVTQAVTVDELVNIYSLKPTHLKIDVEGDEAAVLRGAARTLSTENAPLVFLELHNQIVIERGGDPNEALNLLSGYGYKNAFDDRDFEADDVLRKEIVRIVARKPTASPGPICEP